MASPVKQSQCGFTMTELITVMVIVGIMAAIVAPRFFDRATFDSRGFYDQTISTIRYAQKAAIAQHRLVCVAFTATTITLTIDSNTPADGACNLATDIPSGNMTSPTGNIPYVVTAPAGTSFSPVPAIISFNALGRPNGSHSFTVSGYALRVEAETGYVH